LEDGTILDIAISGDGIAKFKVHGWDDEDSDVRDSYATEEEQSAPDESVGPESTNEQAPIDELTGEPAPTPVV
jgi:hypothetical protein